MVRISACEAVEPKFDSGSGHILDLRQFNFHRFLLGALQGRIVWRHSQQISLLFPCESPIVCSKSKKAVSWIQYEFKEPNNEIILLWRNHVAILLIESSGNICKLRDWQLIETATLSSTRIVKTLSNGCLAWINQRDPAASDRRRRQEHRISWSALRYKKKKLSFFFKK